MTARLIPKDTDLAPDISSMDWRSIVVGWSSSVLGSCCLLVSVETWVGRSQTQRTGYVLSTTGQMLCFLDHELSCFLPSGKDLAVLEMNTNRFLGFQ